VAGWKSVEEIVAYQLGVQLRDRILQFVDSGAIPHNYQLRDQICDAARSVPANISEGFDRYMHGQFGYHAGVAKASLGELETHLDEVRKRGFISEALLREFITLLIRTRKTTTGLIRHLRTTEAPKPFQEE
jgi:four helix bundle protein